MSHSALIYSHSVSPRLQYIVDFLSHYYRLQLKLVYDEEKFKSATDTCKINYGYHPLAYDELFIHSHVLLFESSIRPVKIECFERNGYKAFFKTEGHTGFDIFAAIFYLLTRYEEYLPHQTDEYGRYAHENSVAFREGFLQLPLINIWLEDFRKLLGERNPEFLQTKEEGSFSFIPTYDIDMAWVFRNKGFKRNAGGILLLFLKGKFRRMMHRIRVARRKKTDPYDAYDWMDQLHGRHQLNPIYFFLVAKDIGHYDKNIDTENPEFRELVRSIASRYETGLHPSWASGDAPSLLPKEKKVLENIIDKKVDSSRQHFIRFHLPTTYQHLLSCGITEEYSMGYGSINGFRASIASSFYWYDLKAEEKTRLQVHPFCFMDANAYYEQHLTPEAALEELLQFYKLISEVNGTMITIWHNSFLGTSPEFKGWKEVYERFVSTVTT